MNDEEKIRQINTLLERTTRMNYQIEINTNKLNDAIKEMRGLVGFVRPLAKKNAWYGEEIDGEVVNSGMNVNVKVPENYDELIEKSTESQNQILKELLELSTKQHHCI